jgi:hypothetical protein
MRVATTAIDSRALWWITILQASLLGYKTYADFVLEDNMAAEHVLACSGGVDSRRAVALRKLRRCRNDSGRAAN